MITVIFANNSKQVINPTIDFYVGKNGNKLTDSELIEKVKDLTHDLPGQIYKISILYRGRTLEINKFQNNPDNFIKDFAKEKEIKQAERSLIKSLKKELINPTFTVKLFPSKKGFLVVNIKKAA